MLRLARENPCWGYRRIHSELLVVGIKIAPSTVWKILRQAGVDPAPERACTTWADFLCSQADALLAARRRARPRPGQIARDRLLLEFVRDRLRERWSPEQISRELRREFPGDPGRRVVHETICQAVCRPELGGLSRELPARVLRSGGSRRKPRRRPGERRPNGITGMTMTGERPAAAAGRAEPGHWEGDLITGASSRPATGTVVDRAPRFTTLLHLPGRHTAEAVRDALIAAMPGLPPSLRRSLTRDQGKEMALHAEITAALGLPVYFCDKASPGSGHPTRTPAGCCASTSPRAAICACTGPATWPRWRRS